MAIDAFDSTSAETDPGNSVDVVVPADERWNLLSIAVLYQASSQPAARNVRVEMLPSGGGDALGGVQANADILPNSTAVGLFGPGVPGDRFLTDGTFSHPIPRIVLQPNEVIRVRDGIGIDPIADAIRVRISYEQIKV